MIEEAAEWLVIIFMLFLPVLAVGGLVAMLYGKVRHRHRLGDLRTSAKRRVKAKRSTAR